MNVDFLQYKIRWLKTTSAKVVFIASDIMISGNVRAITSLDSSESFIIIIGNEVDIDTIIRTLGVTSIVTTTTFDAYINANVATEFGEHILANLPIMFDISPTFSEKGAMLMECSLSVITDMLQQMTILPSKTLNGNMPTKVDYTMQVIAHIEVFMQITGAIVTAISSQLRVSSSRSVTVNFEIHVTTVANVATLSFTNIAITSSYEVDIVPEVRHIESSSLLVSVTTTSDIFATIFVHFRNRIIVPILSQVDITTQLTAARWAMLLDYKNKQLQTLNTKSLKELYLI